MDVNGFNVFVYWQVVKQQKRQHKKERFEHMESERKRFGELLSVQTVLNFLGEEETRQAFAEGKDGAVKLEEQELKHLDELYKIINPERGNEERSVYLLYQCCAPWLTVLRNIVGARSSFWSLGWLTHWLQLSFIWTLNRPMFLAEEISLLHYFI